jgi:hypothetical protein
LRKQRLLSSIRVAVDRTPFAVWHFQKSAPPGVFIMQKIFSKRAAGGNMLASIGLLVFAAVGVVRYREAVTVFFNHSPIQNTFVLLVCSIGVIHALISFFRIQLEFVELQRIQDRFNTSDLHWLEPTALAMMPTSMAHERLTFYAEQAAHNCPPNNDAHHDRVVTTLNYRSAITRYISGVLVFLGLLGTIIGLSMSIAAAATLIGNLPTGSESGTAAFFESLKTGLNALLGGMGVAFSTSVFGVITSLILGFVHLQLSAAQDRFIVRLEAFDSAYLTPAFLGKLQASGGGAVGHVTSGGFLNVSNQEALKDNLERLLIIVERTELMQANFREVMVTIYKGIEMTNAAIARLSTNQDLIREAGSAQVELLRGQNEHNRIALAEVQTTNQSLARLNSMIKSGNDMQTQAQSDLVRAIREEIQVLDKRLQGFQAD